MMVSNRNLLFQGSIFRFHVCFGGCISWGFLGLKKIETIFSWKVLTNFSFFLGGDTLPETNSSPLKMDGWNTILSYWEGLFSGAFAVSFREGTVENVALLKACQLWTPTLMIKLGHFTLPQTAKPKGFLCHENRRPKCVGIAGNI